MMNQTHAILLMREFYLFEAPEERDVYSLWADTLTKSSAGAKCSGEVSKVSRGVEGGYFAPTELEAK
jgi:hypothetical protein